jgi:hypothetical protein
MTRRFALLGFLSGMAMALTAVFCSASRAHSWYEGLVDEHGRGCCNTRDCGPIDVEEISGGFRMRHPLTGAPVVVPYGKARPSQDERFHACFVTGEAAPRCFFAPGGV